MSLSRLRSVLTPDDSGCYYECWDCGATLAEEDPGCPTCGSINIVKYEWGD